MVIARMLIRGGLLTLVLTAGMATAKAICRIMRSPALPDAESQGTRSERIGAPRNQNPVPIPRDPLSLVVRELAYYRAPVAAARSLLGSMT